jgi:hypothetical protein
MTKKAIVSVDLASMVGTMKLVPSSFRLPRGDKRLLECAVSEILLKTLQHAGNIRFDGLRSNPNDPPDALFNNGEVCTGIELTELTPPRRYEKDAILLSLRRQILEQLDIGECTRNRWVHISFSDDYAEKLRPGRCGQAIGKALSEYLKGPFTTPVVTIPPQVSDVICSVIVREADLEDDPRLQHPDAPLIVFGPQSTMLVPDDDIPALLEIHVGPKLLHDVSMPTWLLVWSRHPAIGTVREFLLPRLAQFVCERQHAYERAFYLDLSGGKPLIELPCAGAHR